jgi:hypothetical protein
MVLAATTQCLVACRRGSGSTGDGQPLRTRGPGRFLGPVRPLPTQEVHPGETQTQGSWQALPQERPFLVMQLSLAAMIKVCLRLG